MSCIEEKLTQSMIPQIEPLIEPKDIEAVNNYLNSGGWLTEYKVTEQFEHTIADFVGVKYCSVVTSGTTGLILSLMSLGIGKGHRVAVPVLTMIATVNAIVSVGAEPVFIDMDYRLPDNINAVIHVSLNGSPCEINEVLSACQRRNIPLIEDACQSFGSLHLGTYGNVGVYSFSPHKIITTGQGGAIVTNDKTLHRNIELLKDFGREKGGEDFHPQFGINAKFTDLQSAMGLSQLNSINQRLSTKLHIYNQYHSRFPNNIYELVEGEVPWFVMFKSKNPEKLAAYLLTNNIHTRPMYPLITSQPIYRNYVIYPKAKLISDNHLWLPSSLKLTDEQIDYICDCITKGELYG